MITAGPDAGCAGSSLCIQRPFAFDLQCSGVDAAALAAAFVKAGFFAFSGNECIVIFQDQGHVSARMIVYFQSRSLCRIDVHAGQRDHGTAADHDALIACGFLAVGYFDTS